MLIVIRAFFTLLSAVHPSLAGRLGFRLFCTTFKPRKKSANHRAIIDSAEQQFKSAVKHTIVYSGGSIAAFEFLPEQQSTPKGNIWLVHGWQSHSYFMGKFIDPLLDHGYRVITLDLPGHGQTTGRTFHLALAVEAMLAVREHLGSFDSIISHSLGGAVVATTLAGTIKDTPALSVEKLVLISAPDSMRAIFDDFSSMVALSKKANDALHECVTTLTGKMTDDFSIGVQLKKIDCQLLLIHANEDKEVSYSEAEAIAKQIPAATLLPMPGLGHRRIISDDKVVEQAVTFVAG